MTEQGYPPRRPDYRDEPGRPRRGQEPRRNGWQALGGFDETDTDSDLPPWAVPGGIAPNRARRAPRAPHDRPAQGPDRPGRRGLGRPDTARRRADHYEPAQARTAEPRTAEPWTTGHQADPYGDPAYYEEPPGYRRPPGYDGPADYPYGGDRSGDYGRPRGYDEPDSYGDAGGPAPEEAPGRRSRPGGGDRDHDAERAPGRRIGLPGRSRAAAARRRRSQRRLITWGGLAAVVAVLVAGGLYLTRGHPRPKLYIQTFQKGEFRSVPSACKVLSATTLRQIMARAPKVQPVGGGQGQSQCTFTVDVQPNFRILQIQEQAFSPSLIPAGNGSATANAVSNYSQARLQILRPSTHSVWPAGRITPLAGLGDEALTADQASRGPAVTDRVTVLVRYRNVLITVQAQAQESGGFGPVPVTELRSAALTAARATMAAVRHEPTV